MDREEAIKLLKKYNKEEFHILHALTVEGVMKYFAKELGYDETYWGIVGLLHDNGIIYMSIYDFLLNENSLKEA